MNTIKATTIGLLLAKSIGKQHKSEYYKGRICKNRTEGYEVRAAGNSICVSFYFRTGVSYTATNYELAEARLATLQDRIIALLISRGYTVEVIDEQLWEPHSNAAFGYYEPGDLRVTKEAQ